MKTINDVHQQFAAYFGSSTLQPYAYLLSRKMAEGNICLDLDKLSPNDEVLLKEVYPAGLARMDALAAEELVDTAGTGNQPFVLHNNKLYLQRYFTYESILLERTREFVATEKQAFAERVAWIKEQQPLLAKLFSSTPAERNTTLRPTPDWQLAATVTAFLNNFTIITGGPGTGKTTTVAKILALLFTQNPVLKVALAAPTGKAAARMAESLQNARLPVDEGIAARFGELVPATIHRLLKTEYGSIRFKHNRDNPLNVDVVIVDESSMIDVALFAHLMDAIGSCTRLILLGDKDQLASVEAGSLFGDLCQAQPLLNVFSKQRADLVNSVHTTGVEPVPVAETGTQITHPLFEHVIELQKSHRFNDVEGIGKFSKAILTNNQEAIESFFVGPPDQQVRIDADYNVTAFNNFIDQYDDYLREPDIRAALKKFNQLRVLCALREGDQGLYAINRKIEDRLHQRKLLRRSGEFYEHRPIMITSNNYELGLFNGDIGIIRKNEQGVAMAWFEESDGTLKAVLPGYIDQAETVFAMTIHKSQGSEFNKVLIVLPERGAVSLLTRELLYTGITRAKENLTIQGKYETILKAAAEQVKRTSGIIGRFME